jgi:hypothetical protein
MDDGYVDLNARYVEEDEPPTIPDDIPLQEIANEVVRGKRTLSRDQMRLLIELLPYYLSKLPTSHHVRFDFAAALEKATIERAWERSWSAKAPQLNGPVEELPASEAAKPMQRYRRF